MNKKFVTLPNKDDMLKRLIAVDDEPNLVEVFYPILLKNAGNKRVAQGIVMMMILAIHDYAEKMPSAILTSMIMDASKYIDALVDDVDVAQEAKNLFKLK